MNAPRALMAPLALCVLLTACGGGDDPAAGTPADAAGAGGGAATAPAEPTDDPPVDPAADATSTQALSPEPGGEPVTAGGFLPASEIHAYTIEVAAAGAGEELYASVTSSGDLASLTILGPDRAPLIEDTVDASVAPTAAGTHTIIVSAGAAEAEYELTAGLSVPAS